MSTQDDRPAQMDRAVSGSGQPTQVEHKPGAGHWPSDLDDKALADLVRLLDQAVAAAVELPGLDHDLVYAAASARVELRHRRARQRVAEAHSALTRSGWSP